jgi:hypothetical protein
VPYCDVCFIQIEAEKGVTPWPDLGNILAFLMPDAFHFVQL